MENHQPVEPVLSQYFFDKYGGPVKSLVKSSNDPGPFLQICAISYG